MQAESEKLLLVGDHWSSSEVDETAFRDARLGRRFGDLLRRLSDRMGGTIPLACQDSASTKAAYRFFSNPKVEEGDILAGHLGATKARYAGSDGPILVLQDTTEFTYQRRNPHDIGFTKSVNNGGDKSGRLRHHAVCGILMHSSLVVTEEGLPLGLAAVKFWNRDKFKGTAQLKRRINPTRVPIEAKESVRWLDNLRQSVAMLGQPDRRVHVGDRESDIYELYCLAKDLGTHFVVRTVVDRLAGNGDHTVKTEMHEAPSAGMHSIEVRVDNDTVERVTLDIRFKRIHVCPPIGKQKRYPALDLTVIHASEVDAPLGRKPILWKLVTDLEVADLDAAIEKIRWYSTRWKIEVFHKILKSGCRAEDAKLLHLAEAPPDPGMSAGTPFQVNAPGSVVRKRRSASRPAGSYAPARPRRLGHVMCFTPDVPRSVEFMTQALGLGLADHAQDVVAFCCTRKESDHHVVAFAKSSAVGLHHGSFMVEDPDEVGRGGQALLTRSGRGHWGFGRHAIGSNFFHYI